MYPSTSARRRARGDGGGAAAPTARHARRRRSPTLFSPGRSPPRESGAAAGKGLRVLGAAARRTFYRAVGSIHASSDSCCVSPPHNGRDPPHAPHPACWWRIHPAPPVHAAVRLLFRGVKPLPCIPSGIPSQILHLGQLCSMSDAIPRVDSLACHNERQFAGTSHPVPIY